MGDEQCGLCISCGAPFLPSGDEVAFFNKRGNLSILHLNLEFKRNYDLQRRFVSPKFTNIRNDAHIFHVSHHVTALRHMCYNHQGDANITPPPPIGNSIPMMNGPIPFYKTPSKNQNPQLAWWNAPDPIDRIDMIPLLNHIMRIAHTNGDRNANFDEDWDTTYITCGDCNALMTQQAYMAYILGLTASSEMNRYGSIIQGTPIQIMKADPQGRSLPFGYGNWRRARDQHITQHPSHNQFDSLTPHVAYYLHLCLPAIPMGAADIWNIPGSGQSARILYLQLCWVILELSCLCTLIDAGKQSGNGRLSHGFKCHLGAIEFYASYFFWKLFQYEYMQHIPRLKINFIQWHQKYFWDIINCKGIFPTNRILIAEMVCSNVNISSQRLVENICVNMMNLYTNRVNYLVRFLMRDGLLPSDIKEYFMPISAIPLLRNMSLRRVDHNDFDSAMTQFGINALSFRVIQLCKDYPVYLKHMLKDFRNSWQYREMYNIKKKYQTMDMKTAYTLYTLSTLLHPPLKMPYSDKERRVILNGPKCSPWTSVLPLKFQKAFQHVDVGVL